MSAQAEPPAGQTRALAVRLESEFKGDFDRMIERRVIRVAAPFSRTLYFNDKGRERGISADFARDFEQWLNQKYKKQLGKRPLTVVIRPTTRDQLLLHIADGRDDIAVGNLTVTEERLKTVDFVAPDDSKPESELVVTGTEGRPDGQRGRAGGQDRARAQVVELPREPDGAERAVQEGRQPPRSRWCSCPMRSKTKT